MKIILPIVILICITAVTATAYAAGSKQILINNNIQSVDSFGKYNDTAYTDTYSPSNLFDNLINTWSYWSQYGKSAVSVELKQPLNRNVCNVELDVFNPKNTPFNMKLNAGNTSYVDYNGVLDTTNETITIGNCLTDMTDATFTFDAPKKWTTLSEIKFFSNTTGGGGPIEPPVCGPGTHYDPETQQCVPDVIIPPGNVTKLSITNSTVYANLTDSTLVISLDPGTKVMLNGTEVEEEEEDEDEEEKENDKN